VCLFTKANGKITRHPTSFCLTSSPIRSDVVPLSVVRESELGRVASNSLQCQFLHLIYCQVLIVIVAKVSLRVMLPVVVSPTWLSKTDCKLRLRRLFPKPTSAEWANFTIMELPSLGRVHAIVLSTTTATTCLRIKKALSATTFHYKQ
jgi:hypothetical protein